MRTALTAFVLPAFLLGCAVTAERESLPTGVTLLGSDAGYCDGPIEVHTDPTSVVDQGQSVTLEVDDEELDWRCLAGSPRAGGDLECPAGTSYVRITREAEDAQFSLECFGD